MSQIEEAPKLNTKGKMKWFWPLEGKFSIYYQIFMLFNCLSILMIWGARIAFEEKPYSFIYIYEFYLDGVFIIDAIRIFNTPIFTENGKLVLDRKLIARQYLRSWFALDLWSFYPLGYLRYISIKELGDKDDNKNFIT